MTGVPTSDQREGRVAEHVQEVAAQHGGRVARRCRREGAHRRSPPWCGGAGAAGEGEEHVVEVGGVDGQLVHLDAGASSRSSRGAASATVPSPGTCRQRLVVPAGVASGRAAVRPRSANRSRTWPPGTQPLELVGGALGDDPAAVEHRDPVGELVGLLQVLGGEEDRDAAGDQLADHLPHGPAAARVEPGGRLVQEDDPRARRSGSWRGRVGAACRPSRSTAGSAASSRSKRSSSPAARRRPASRPR